MVGNRGCGWESLPPHISVKQEQVWNRKQGWATSLSACAQWPNSYSKSLPSNGSTTPPNSATSVQILNLIVHTLHSLHNRQGVFSFYALTVQSLSLNHKQSRQINRRKRLYLIMCVCIRAHDVYEPPRSDKVWNLGVGFGSYGRVKRIVWWMQVILDCPLVKCVCFFGGHSSNFKPPLLW